MNKIIIDFEDFRTKKAKVFTGRDRGRDVREKSGLDKISLDENVIEIHVPENIYSINPSFLEEFLVNIVLLIGKDQFNDKVTFICKGDYDINLDLEEATDRILRDNNALM